MNAKAGDAPTDERPEPAGDAPGAIGGERTALLDALKKVRRGGRTRIVYRDASLAEVDAYRRWIDAALAGPAVPLEGFESQELAGGDLLLLREARGARRGAGAVVLRRGATNRVILQAPHTFFDQGTLQIGVALFSELRAVALQINTVHRGNPAKSGEAKLDERARSGEVLADLAHQEHSFFQAAHASLLTGAAPLTIQVHGFRDALLPGSDLVVSAAGSLADARAVVRLLRRDWPALRVRLNPDETRKLGGTKNSQGKHCRNRRTPFLHLEISKTLRERLLEQPALVSRLASALKPQVPTVEGLRPPGAGSGGQSAK